MTPRPQFRVLIHAVVILCGATAPIVSGQSTSSSSTNAAADPLKRIREEGFNRSKVMETVAYLTDVIGPRLTGSPQMKRANEWTRAQLAGWGLTNAQLEPWGPFGRGWSLRHFSAQLIEPEVMPLIALPKAWSPSLDYPVVADVVYVEGGNDAELARYKGKLRGAIVLSAPARELKPRFEPLASRLNETNLLRLANAGEPGSRAPLPSENERTPSRNANRATTNTVDRSTNAAARSTNAVLSSSNEVARATNNPARTNTPSSTSRTNFSRTAFLMAEGAAVLLTPSYTGDGGSIFLEAASVPSGSGSATNVGRSAWSTNAPPFLPQISLSIEHYNRLVRLAKRGEKLRMQVELRSEFHHDDLMAYNTVAEIPGTDLAEELVMLGAHLDSWHGGTGATDNAAGVAVCLEAVRILQAVGLQPRRTIRVALWSGEEQGLLGSRAYVTKHFGYTTNVVAGQTNVTNAESPRGREQREERPRQNSSRRPERKIIHHPDHAKLSAYFNLDNGAGKIRGIYLQGNEACRPIFRRWLAPFADFGAETITASNTGGTDHQSFDGVGLPGFQFIQDGLDYWTLTHHSNMDVFDRIVPDDLKQASVIMATFIYQAAMSDEKLPRKPATPPATRGASRD